MKRIYTYLLAAVLLVCTIAPAAGSPLEQEAARLVNQQRSSRGLRPYVFDQDLSSKARIKSRDLARGGYFDHTSPTYGSPFAMMRSLGISFTSAGENLAKGYTSAPAVVSAWMKSERHRANILSPVFTTMGIGYEQGHWTQWFTRK